MKSKYQYSRKELIKMLDQIIVQFYTLPDNLNIKQLNALKFKLESLNKIGSEEIECPGCHGYGEFMTTDGTREECWQCKGTGKKQPSKMESNKKISSNFTIITEKHEGIENTPKQAFVTSVKIDDGFIDWIDEITNRVNDLLIKKEIK